MDVMQARPRRLDGLKMVMMVVGASHNVFRCQLKTSFRIRNRLSGQKDTQKHAAMVGKVHSVSVLPYESLSE